MVSRRTFLAGGAAAAGVALVVGWGLYRPDPRLEADSPLEGPRADAPLNGWVMIGTDDRVTIVMAKAEMGQGIHTGAAMLLAEELEADWARVRVVQSPLDSIYTNRENLPQNLSLRPDDDSVGRFVLEDLARRGARYVGGTMLTGGSTSIVDLWLPMRRAGASARMMLCSAAARKWKVPADQCLAKSGRVMHPPTGRSATFGELVADARREKRPADPPLKHPSTYTLIGRRQNRIEARAKLDGTARFGIDSFPDKLLYASILMCPTLGGRVKRFDASKIKPRKGVHGYYPVEPYLGGTGGVAVIADNPFIAMRALCDLPTSVEWDPGPAAGLDTDKVRDALRKALDGDGAGRKFYEEGDVGQALKDHAARKVEMTYEVPYLAHGTLEPVNCTVRVKDGLATVWVSTQVPMVARDAVAHVLKLDKDSVRVHQQLIGGGFGRRLEADYVAQAAAIAAHARGVPVQTIWTRPQDMAHDFYRPGCMARYTGALDADGRLVAWRGVSASQSIAEQVLPRTFHAPAIIARLLPDQTMGEGAFDQPYECPNISVRHRRVDLPIPVGFWRSVGHSHQAFFVESFIDEMAAKAGRDPIAFRLAMLQRPAHRRHAQVLRTLAERSAWQSPLTWKEDGVDHARGVAMHASFGSVVAQVAEVRRQVPKQFGDPDFRVTRVVCVIDCGMAVNPNLVEQQMESGIIFGLSAALHEAITFRNGGVEQRYFSDYLLVDMPTCPEIETFIISGDDSPQGVGEAGTPPIAPAVANALFALTGKRRYQLPLLEPGKVPEGGDPWCQSVSTARP